MNILSTIVPVFVIILLGLYARHRGFFTPEFLDQANRLVYYIAIPAMIFSSIAKASLKTETNMAVILITLSVLVVVAAMAFVPARVLNMPKPSRGSFIHSSFHGNLGYIGFAVAFYYLGNQGFVKAAIISGFVMILQNLLAVLVLQFHSEKNEGGINLADTLKKPWPTLLSCRLWPVSWFPFSAFPSPKSLTGLWIY
nr:hypothetical protein [Desulfobacula sp.]